MVLALAVVGALEVTGLVTAFVPVALALTTTALGTLLPILKDNGMLQGTFGAHVFTAGAVGELWTALPTSSSSLSSSSTQGWGSTWRPSPRTRGA